MCVHTKCINKAGRITILHLHMLGQTVSAEGPILQDCARSFPMQVSTYPAAQTEEDLGPFSCSLDFICGFFFLLIYLFIFFYTGKQF